jgi:hypothetical protein
MRYPPTVLVRLLVCAMLPLAACAQAPRLTSQEPPEDSVMTLLPGENITLIAVVADDDGAAIPTCVRDSLYEATPGLAIMPASEFRAIVGFRFATTPTSDDDIKAVLADPAVQAAARRLALRYLVIVGGTTEQTVTSPHAVYIAERHSYVQADVWDVPAAAHAGEFAAHAWGTFEAILVPLAYTATEKEACERVVQMLAKRLS